MKMIATCITIPPNDPPIFLLQKLRKSAFEEQVLTKRFMGF